MSNEHWSISRRWEDVQMSSTSDEPIKYSLSDSGIDCDIEYDVIDEGEIWIVSIRPEEAFASGCALLVDLLFTLDDRDFRVEREMCEERVEVLRVRRKFKSNATFCVCFRVIDLYTIHDLSIPTGNRNFQLICESKSQYVDTRYLSSIGGSVFTEWNQMSCSGESKLEITDMTLTSFECLIDATCKYGNIVVTSDNYESLLSIASMYGITSILRKIESCLIEMKTVHPIRKLELAAIYRLAQLGDVVARKLRASDEAIPALHHYMTENGDSLREMHPDVLLSLGIHPKYIVK